MNRRVFLGIIGAGLGYPLAGRLGTRLPTRPFASGGSLDGERLVERWSWAMGQPVHLMLFAQREEAGLEAAAIALAELRSVEAALSLFDPASDLVALNERAGRGPVRVSPELLRVLRRAEGFRVLTKGAFDAAIEPLMRAWGFHSSRATAPSPAELAEACRSVAAARIRLTGETASLLSPEARIDLGGIGVGYGLDRAAEALRQAGIRRALVDVSGDLIALGPPPGRSGWPVQIASPAEGEPVGRVELVDSAVATSANTKSVVRYGETVAGHVLDPSDGRPARGFVQVSVVARTGVAADALSTAMLVSGRRFSGVREIVPVG